MTSKTPATAAGKVIAEKAKQAREAQKRALAEAQIIIDNNRLKQAQIVAADPPPVADTPSAESPPSESTKNILTTTQWLSVISVFVSLAGIYYKREEIKSLLAKPQTQANTMPPAPPPSPVDVVPRAPKRKGGVRPMD